MKLSAIKKISVLTLCFMLAVFALCACSSKEEEEKVNDTSVIGTWQESFFESGFVFNADGTGTDTFWNLTFTYTAYDGELTLIYDDDMWGASTYTYTVSGNELTMLRTDSDSSEFTYEKVTSSSTTATTAESDTDESAGETTAEETT